MTQHTRNENFSRKSTRQRHQFEMQKGNRYIYHTNIYIYTFPSCRENEDSRVYIGGEFDDEISGECRATDAEHKSLGDKGSRKPS